MNNSTDISVMREKPSLNYEAIPQVLPIAILILLTNGVVFVLFWKRRGLRTPSNYLLLSLAISDFMTGLINIPLFLSFSVLMAAHPIPELYNASDVFHKIISFSIAYHITAVTAEKYLAIVNPFGRMMRTKKTALKIALIIWFWSLLLGSAPAFWFNLWLEGEPFADHMQASYNIFCLVVVFLVPFIFILYAYCIMFRAIASRPGFQARKARKASKQEKDTTAFNKASNETKCLIILMSMAIAFAICWLPWFLLRLLYSLINIEWLQEEVVDPLKPMAHIFVIVRYLSSAINPLLYTFFKQDFWGAFRIVVLKKDSKMLSKSTRMGAKKPRTSASQMSTLLLEDNTRKDSSSV
ncbi:neuromedin-U receptor 2-like [Montipora capricornis]|uniref:neuromedin-U receptor 2-like n=1 Tax=Montipora capricornis TaxID=246305 RepID=UPI0035F145B0